MKKNWWLLVFGLWLHASLAQHSTVILWDSSLSMIDRDLERDLNFLDNYFSKYPETNGTLISFSNAIIQESKFIVEQGDWSDLRKELELTIYDGGTNYEGLFETKADHYLVFTDGIETFSKLRPSFEQPIYFISTTANTNKEKLMRLADISEGRMIDLSKQQPNPVKNTSTSNENAISSISGTVRKFSGPLSKVNIINQNTNEGTSTDAEGNFTINASKDDIIQFTYVGMRPVNVVASSNDDYEITMSPKKETLDEVVLNANVETDETVNTGNGVVDKRRLGYDVQTIGSEEVSELDTDVQQAVKGQFAGLELPNDSAQENFDITQFRGRHKGMSMLTNQFGLVVIDGIPQETSDSKKGGFVSNIGATINPDLIHSITYLKGLAATNKYGTLGMGGVLVIVTKNAVGDKPIEEVKIPTGTTGTYSGNAASLEELPDEPYIKRLTRAKTIDEAFIIYLEEREKFGSDPIFYLDVYTYFKDWNNPMLSDRILSNASEIGFDDPLVLKAIGYLQQEKGDWAASVKTFERVQKISPTHAQSYLDLATAYAHNDQPRKALKIFKQAVQKNNSGEIDLLGIMTTFRNEFKNLIYRADGKLNLSGIDPIYLKNIAYNSRIIFQWNDLNSEFELNIVNPQNRFFTVSNTIEAQPQKFEAQMAQGFGTEEFYLTNADKGNWQFNLKYLGKSVSKELPTFLKVTTYTNFGQPNQQSSVKVIRLSKRDMEHQIAKIVVK